MVIEDMRKVSIDLNDSEGISSPASSVQAAMEGKNQSKAYDITRDCTVHKEMERTGLYKKEKKDKNNFSLEDDKNLPGKFMIKTLTADDFGALESEGVPVEQCSSSNFDREIKRIKEERASRQESVDRQADQMREERKQMERSVVMSAVKGTPAERMLNHLSSANLPVTAEAAVQLAGAVDMTVSIRSLSGGGMNQLIENTKAITPENIKQSSYIKDTKWNEFKDGFEQMKGQIEAVFQAGGREVTKEGLEAAKYLFANHLPVTLDNIDRYENVTQLQELDTDTIINRIVDCIADGFSAEESDLTLISREEAANLVKQFQSVSDETLRKRWTTEADFITAKRQLEEIRLKLTLDAARELKSKGFSIDTTHLQEVVEGLREREQAAYEDMLKAGDAPATPDNIEMVRETFTLIDQIRSAPSAILGSTIDKGMQQTLREFASEGVLARQTYPDLEKVYEAVGTEVRKDLGDSIHKAFQNVDSILEGLELPDTVNNERAVRILAYNRMDITRENIAGIKEYDSKVNHLIKNMTPAAVTSMVKEKINPMELSMEELTETLQDISAEQLPNDESFRKFLWKLDKNGTLTSEERKSIVGIYRLLDKVEKSDGSVIGALVKQDREITLSSLLSAVRTEKNGGIQAKIDDDFGGLKEVMARGTSISDQISAAFGETVVTDLRKSLSPEMLNRFGDDAMTMPLDLLLEECSGAVEENQAYYQMRADEIRMIKEAAKDAESFLEKCKIPDSIQNLSMAKAYLENGLAGKKAKWNREDSEKVTEALEDKDTLEAAYREVEDAQLEAIEKQKETAESHNEIQELRQMSQSISFYRILRKREMYEVPIITEKGITTVNITIQDSNASVGSGTVQIRMDSEELGQIHATFKLKGRELTGFITSEDENDLSAGREIFERMEQRLSDGGYQIKNIAFAKGFRGNVQIGEQVESEASVKSMYQVAKIFIGAIS